MSSDALLLLRARGLTKVYSSVESPVARLGEALFRRPSPGRQLSTVLADVDLDIYHGETVGIIGRNGAGKTTLLAILGRVLDPTSGTVERLGKVATLLEVGAGFNPHFTGRDNARLFCGIMGLTSQQTTERLPAIEEFADLGEYFDMPLRTYSSGMQARLGFACAAHVDAELVIIDETLAVGDASFRVKCYMRIKAMQAQGQTFLLVSHSPNLIANFCSRAVVLEKGRKVFDGGALDAFDVYKEIREGLERQRGRAIAAMPKAAPDPRLAIRSVRVKEHRGEDGSRVELEAELVAGADLSHPLVSFGLRNQEGIVVCSYGTDAEPGKLPPMRTGEKRRLRLQFRNLLLPGVYFISARTGQMVGDVLTTLNVHHNIGRLEVVTRSTNQGLVDLGMRLEVQEAEPDRPIGGKDPGSAAAGIRSDRGEPAASPSPSVGALP